MSERERHPAGAGRVEELLREVVIGDVTGKACDAEVVEVVFGVAIDQDELGARLPRVLGEEQPRGEVFCRAEDSVEIVVRLRELSGFSALHELGHKVSDLLRKHGVCSFRI